MRIVFMGTPEFAVPSLRALVENGYNVVAVITQPDRPKGRGGKIAKSPVKIYAEAQNIPVYQPLKIKNEAAMLRGLAPDICITAAFGQILSQEILDIPKKTINVHASLLPYHRGSAPATWSILNGDKYTGVTTMLTDRGIDTGDMLLSEKIEIYDNDTAASLLERLSELGARLIVKTLENIDTLVPIKQDSEIATYDPMIKKEFGKIAFDDAEYICRQVRAMQPWPNAYIDISDNYKIKITEVAIGKDSKAEAGTVVCADTKEGIVIATNTKDLIIKRLQAPGKKEMDAKAFLLGNKLKAGVNYKFAFEEKQ